MINMLTDDQLDPLHMELVLDRERILGSILIRLAHNRAPSPYGHKLRYEECVNLTATLADCRDHGVTVEELLNYGRKLRRE